jgi:hypothetical protein
MIAAITASVLAEDKNAGSQTLHIVNGTGWPIALAINSGFPVLVQKGGRYDFVYYESNEEGVITRLLVQVNDAEGDLPIRTFKVVAKQNTTCTIPEYGSTDWQDFLQTN